MDETRVLDLLLRSFKDHSDSKRRPAGVNRRQVILAAGAATAALVTGAYVFGALVVRRRGKALEVALGGHTWVIDPARFGSSTCVHWHSTRRMHEIRLLDAKLPGTDLDLSYDCRLKYTSAGWRSTITFHESRRAHEFDLAQWLASSSGLEATGTTGRVRLGNRVSLDYHRCQWLVDPEHTVRIIPSSAGSISLHLPSASFRAGCTTLSAIAGEEVADLGLDPCAHARVTKASLTAITDRLDLHSLATDARGRAISLAFDRLDGATLIAHEHGGISDVLLEGRGVITRNDGPANRTMALRLDRIAHWARIDHGSGEAVISGQLSRQGFGVDVGAFVAHMRGHSDDLMVLRIQEQRLLSGQFRAVLYELNASIEGADTSRLSFAGLPVDVALHADGAPDQGGIKTVASKTVAETSSPEVAAPPVQSWTKSGLGYVILDPDAPYLFAPLDEGRLHIGRGLDLLDLGFEFRNYDIKVDLLEGAVAYPSSTADCAVPARRPRLIVTLPPQHVQEQAFERQIDGVGSFQPNARPFESRSWAPDPKEPSDKPKAKPFEPIVQARVANRSRLVFEDCDSKHKPKPIRLRVDDLTQWDRFNLVVSPRAAPPPTVAEQLGFLKIAVSTTRSEAFDKIRASLIAPAQDETAIEFPYRLLLSPNVSAKWETPKGRPKKKGAVLWHARLSEANGSTVRAVWARQIDLGFLNGTEPNDRGGKIAFSLNGSDRRQLVTLSSVYGLPSLRRLAAKQVWDQDLSAPGAHPPLPQPDQNNTSGTVVRPDQPYAFLQSDQEGVWVPKPLELADIVLTPLGANCDLEWKGEPPAPISLGQKPVWGPAVAVERWRHQAVLGRDVHVQVDYKGFLMPLGHRAALVKLTERHFYRHPTQHVPTAYLIQRRFIVVNKPLKTFPALNQPQTGRAFPASQVNILTHQTPDLVNPETPGADGTANGRVDEGPGLVFWPRTKPLVSGGDPTDGLILFEWSVNGEATPIRSPLMFVDNAAAHDATRVQKAVERYNAFAPAYRTAQHGGASRRYAAELKAGEARYDTSSWTLTSIPGTLASYVMDAAMEGQDQPPFYPAMDRGFITIQTVDRLLGRPQGLIEIGVNQRYLDHEFDGTTNPAELFLDIYTPGILLDVSGQGDAAGGVAKPSAALAALSRKIGLVGGKKPDSSARTSNQKKAGKATPPQDTPPYTIDQAANGNLDPTEFFGGVKNASLLGIVPLSSVIHVILNGIGKAPKLLETIQYRLGQSIALQPMKDAAQAVFTAINGAMATLQSDADAALLKLNISKVTWQQLYPDLAAAFQGLTKVIANATGTVNAATTEVDLFSALTPVVGAITQMKEQIQKLVENPMPSLLQSQFDSLKEILQGLDSLGKSGGVSFGEMAWKQLVPEFVDACNDLPAQTRQLLFGSAPDICTSLLSDPVAALHTVQETLFYDVFGQSLAEAFTVAQRLKSQFTASVYLVGTQVRAVVLEAIQSVPGTIPDTEAQKLADAFQSIATSAFTTSPDLGSDPLGESNRRIADVEAKIKNTLELEIGDPTLRDSIRLSAMRALHALIDPQVNDLVRFVSDRIAAAQRSAVRQIFDTATSALQSLRNTAEIGWVNAALAMANDWCAGATGQLSAAEDFARTVASALIADANTLLNYLQSIDDSIGSLQLPAGSPPDAALAVDRARAAFNGVYNDLVTALADLQKARSLLLNAPPVSNVCSQVATFLPLVDQIVRLRSQSVTIIGRAVGFLVDVQNVVNGLGSVARVRAKQSQTPEQRASWSRLSLPANLQPIKDAITAITNALAQALADLTSINQLGQKSGGAPSPTVTKLQHLISALQNENSLSQYRSYVGELAQIVPQLQGAAAKILANLQSVAGNPATLNNFCADVIAYAIQQDRHLAAVVLKSVVAGNQVWNALDKHVATAVGALATLLEQLHVAGANAAGLIKGLVTDPIIQMLIRPDLVTALTSAQGLIQADAQTLDGVAKATSSGSFAALDAAQALLKQWNQGPIALVSFVELAAGAIDSLVHGQLGSIFNFSQLEEELRNALADFVPSKIDLAYDWSTPVQEFQSLFKMEAGPTDDDLALHARVSIDLLQQTRTVQAGGTLKPFWIHILGDSPDLLKIHFKGATFQSSAGQGMNFDAPIDRVEIGTALSFVEALSSYMNPGDSGLYVLPTFTQIEVGWTYDAGIIDLGDVQFINVALSVAVKLPLDNRAASIEFSLASQEAPFLIAADPYGGGGFVGLEICATSVVGVHTSLEFGAVVAVQFGPLSGEGRVTAGIYISKDNDGAVLAGFVHAVGEGHIACFGVSINLEVGVVDDNGAVSGYSHYSMSFSVGFVTLSFGFDAQYTISGASKKSGGMAQNLDDSGNVGISQKAHALANASPLIAIDCCSKEQRAMRAGSPNNRVFVRLVPEKSHHWDTYQPRIDFALLTGAPA
jgi:hypothetical protein